MAQKVKNMPANVEDLSLILKVRNIPWRREWLPTPVFLPGEFHGQRSLVGYSLLDCKESIVKRAKAKGKGNTESGKRKSIQHVQRVLNKINS